MALTFYCGSGSPYAWRVWLALEHKQLPYELRMLSFDAGDLRTPGYLAINPRGKVPAIVDDGFALYESAAIVEYLEDRYPAPRPEQALFPRDVHARALTRRLVQEIDQYFAPATERLVDQILFTAAAGRDAGAIEAAAEACGAELARHEPTIHGEFLAGALPSAADFALYPLLALVARMEKKDPTLSVTTTLGPRLTDWRRRIEALPYFARTFPPHWK